MMKTKMFPLFSDPFIFFGGNEGGGGVPECRFKEGFLPGPMALDGYGGELVVEALKRGEGAVVLISVVFLRVPRCLKHRW